MKYTFKNTCLDSTPLAANKKSYTITGWYYLSGTIACRKLLYIRNEAGPAQPDLLVIMMNPGGSHPTAVKSYRDIREKHCGKLISAEPDKTQFKIMDFMTCHGFRNACIVNLLDKCETDSSRLRKKDDSFSNFGSQQKAIAFLRQHAPQARAVMMAWGCKSIFKDLIKNVCSALDELNIRDRYGYPQIGDTDKLFYYHPLIRGKKWLCGIEVICPE